MGWRLERALLLLLPLVFSCGEEESSLERIRDRGFLRAAYTQEAPYAFRDESGEILGESPTALRAVVEELGIGPIRWTRLDFDELLPALVEGRVDVIGAGMFPTDSRREIARFSRPTICAGPALVLHEGSAIRSLDELGAADRGPLAVLSGSMEEDAARELGFRGDRLLTVPDLATGLAAVTAGSAEALAVTAPTARRALAESTDRTLAVRPYRPPARVRDRLSGCSALAFRQADSTLARAADEVLVRWVGSDRHLDAVAPLGFTRRDLPPSRGLPVTGPTSSGGSP